MGGGTFPGREHDPTLPPQWGGVCSSKGSHRREQTERPQNEMVVVVVVVVVECNLFLINNY